MGSRTGERYWKQHAKLNQKMRVPQMTRCVYRFQYCRISAHSRFTTSTRQVNMIVPTDHISCNCAPHAHKHYIYMNALTNVLGRNTKAAANLRAPARK